MATKKSRKSSRYYQDYMRQRRRVQRFINRAEKRGYSFEYSLPPIPKNITQSSVSRLEKITPQLLYQKAEFISPMSGEILTGIEGRKLERKEAAIKAAKTRKTNQLFGDIRDDITYGDEQEFVDEHILDEIERLIDSFSTDGMTPNQAMFHLKNRNIIKEILNQRIIDEGRYTVAQRLNEYETAGDITSLVERIMYDSNSKSGAGAIESMIQHFASIINGGALTPETAQMLDDSFYGML